MLKVDSSERRAENDLLSLISSAQSQSTRAPVPRAEGGKG